jgi:TrmH family RNA methyltransferase
MLSKSRLKYIQTLGQKKFRQEEGFFLAEGPKIVAELLEEKSGYIKEIFALPEWIETRGERPLPCALTAITEAELEKISQLSQPNEVIALIRQFDEQPVKATGRLVLALDHIQDPGNLGTIIRIADWFGVQDIVCSPDSADRYNPKVVQSTMGSIARVNLCYTDLEQWLDEQKDIEVYAAVLGGTAIGELEKIKEGIILIGNESRGISEAVLAKADRLITIPKKGRAESLNAAVATGIILHQLT